MLPEWLLALVSFGVSITYLLRYFSNKNATHLTPVLAWLAMGLAYLYYVVVPVPFPDRASVIRTILFIIGFSEIARNILLLRYGKRD